MFFFYHSLSVLLLLYKYTLKPKVLCRKKNTFYGFRSDFFISMYNGRYCLKCWWGSSVQLYYFTQDSKKKWNFSAVISVSFQLSILFLACSHPISYIHISQKSAGQYSLQSQDCHVLSAPEFEQRLGKWLLGIPSDWKILQNGLKHNDLISLNAFESILKDLETDSLVCLCLNWYLSMHGSYCTAGCYTSNIVCFCFSGTYPGSMKVQMKE